MPGAGRGHGGDVGDECLTATPRPLFFPCAGERLFGICHVPEVPLDIGVVVVVGGPQYRVGSHRQFHLLARDLGERGIACLCFDYRGMGDSTGNMRSFDSIDDDIRAAVDALMEQVPVVRRIVLWGLCDGASAAAFYACHDARVAGLVLLNPWVRTESGEAKAYLKNYYLQRLVSGAFLAKLLSGEFRPWRSLQSLLGNIRAARNRSSSADVASGRIQGDLPARVVGSLARFKGEVLFILSGNDFVAQEFESVVADVRHRAVLAASRFGWHRLAEANHTFSTAAWRSEVAKVTAGWVVKFAAPVGGDKPGSAA